MEKIDWKRKLSSRKFWLAVVGFVTAVLAFVNVEPETTERIVAMIMAGATLIAYVLAEGFADAKAVEGEK